MMWPRLVALASLVQIHRWYSCIGDRAGYTGMTGLVYMTRPGHALATPPPGTPTMPGTSTYDEGCGFACKRVLWALNDPCVTLKRHMESF